MSRPKAIHFGAGNIGRGFIGPLLVESAYHVVFADVDQDIIKELNEQGSYTVHVLDEHEYRQSISSVSGILSQTNNVISEFSDPNVRIVTTAAGASVLEKIAPLMAKGLQARRKASAGALNVIACENMVDQTAQLARYISTHLSSEDKAWVDEHIGFANCCVDRIVPTASHEDQHHPLDVGVEGFYEWIVDETALKRAIEPKIKGMQLTDGLGGYIDRKLFTLNCGHAITAYLGYLHQYQTIDQAIQDPEIRKVVHDALHEGGAALIKKHGFKAEDHQKYIETIIERFENPNLKDDVVRVGRQPLRKLKKGDRLLGPTYMAHSYGLPIHNLLTGIAAALLYDVEDDEQSREMQKNVKCFGIGKAAAEITGFEEGSEEYASILRAYRDLSRTHLSRTLAN